MLAFGLVAFGLWQLLLAAKGFRWVRGKGRRGRKRVGAAASGIVGIALALAAASYATGSGASGTGNEQQQTMTAKLLALPAGPFLVGLVALVVVGVAVAIAARGFRKSFLDELNVADLPSGTRRWVTRLGVLGFVAKGVTFGVIGVLIGIAAFRHDPKQRLTGQRLERRVHPAGIVTWPALRAASEMPGARVRAARGSARSR